VSGRFYRACQGRITYKVGGAAAPGSQAHSSDKPTRISEIRAVLSQGGPRDAAVHFDTSVHWDKHALRLNAHRSTL